MVIRRTVAHSTSMSSEICRARQQDVPEDIHARWPHKHTSNQHPYLAFLCSSTHFPEPALCLNPPQTVSRHPSSSDTLQITVLSRACPIGHAQTHSRRSTGLLRLQIPSEFLQTPYRNSVRSPNRVPDWSQSRLLLTNPVQAIGANALAASEIREKMHSSCYKTKFWQIF